MALKRDIEAEKAHELTTEVIREIRKLRAENNVMPNKTIKLKIYAKNKNAELLADSLDLISGIVKSDDTEMIDRKIQDPNLVYSVIKSGVEVYIDTANALDVEKEQERLKEQIIDTKEYISILDKKLLNESFVRNAPRDLVRSEMEKKELAKQKLRKLEEKFNSFS